LDAEKASHPSAKMILDVIHRNEIERTLHPDLECADRETLVQEVEAIIGIFKM
jgi:hypothetical protein